MLIRMYTKIVITPEQYNEINLGSYVIVGEGLNILSVHKTLYDAYTNNTNGDRIMEIDGVESKVRLVHWGC